MTFILLTVVLAFLTPSYGLDFIPYSTPCKERNFLCLIGYTYEKGNIWISHSSNETYPYMALHRYLTDKSKELIPNTTIGSFIFAGSNHTYSEIVSVVDENGGGKLQFMTKEKNNENPSRITIGSKGYLGIGTENPQYPLHISQNNENHNETNIKTVIEGDMFLNKIFISIDNRLRTNNIPFDTKRAKFLISNLELEEYTDINNPIKRHSGIKYESVNQYFPTFISNLTSINYPIELQDLSIVDLNEILFNLIGAQQDLIKSMNEYERMIEIIKEFIDGKGKAIEAINAEKELKEKEREVAEEEAKKTLYELEKVKEKTKQEELITKRIEYNKTIEIAKQLQKENELKIEQEKTERLTLELENNMILLEKKDKELEEMEISKEKALEEVKAAHEITLQEQIKLDISNIELEKLKIKAEEEKTKVLYQESLNREKEIKIRILEEEEKLKMLEIELEKEKGEQERNTTNNRMLKEKELEEEKIRLSGEKVKKELEMKSKEKEIEISLEKEKEIVLEKERRESAKLQSENIINQEKTKAEEERITKLKLLEAEIESKAEMERKNEDLNIRKIKVQAELEKEKWIDSIKTTIASIGSGIYNFLTDTETIKRTIITLSCIVLSYYTIKESSRIISNLIEKNLGKPYLIRETSRTNMFNEYIRGFLSLFIKEKSYNEIFEGVILNEDLERRIKNLSNSTKNARIHKSGYRNVLFYGSPGTGKSLVARRLAFNSGLDYAIMSGGDVSPLGKEGVNELHKLFEWSRKSRNGLILFIDEAECLLSNRNERNLSENQRNALNCILYESGSSESNKKLMLIIATNRPCDLDNAIIDRIDESLEFELPNERSREKLLKYYFERDICKLENNKDEKESNNKENKNVIKKIMNKIFKTNVNEMIKLKNINKNDLVEVNKKLIGFSGREINKLTNTIRNDVYGKNDLILDKESLLMIIKEKLEDHNIRSELLKENKSW